MRHLPSYHVSKASATNWRKPQGEATAIYRLISVSDLPPGRLNTSENKYYATQMHCPLLGEMRT